MWRETLAAGRLQSGNDHIAFGILAGVQDLPLGVKNLPSLKAVL